MPDPNRLDQLQENQTYTTPEGRFRPEFIRQWELIVKQVKRLAAAVAAIVKLNDTVITTTTPITGGGALSGPPTAIGHALSGVTPGAYTNANITVDATGHVTAAASGGGGGGGPSPFWPTAPGVPVTGTFTVLSGAGAAAAQTGLSRGVMFEVSAGGVGTVRNGFFYQATPGATWTATTLIVPNGGMETNDTIGIAVRDSATGRIQNFGLMTPNFFVNNWTDINTFSANLLTPNPGYDTGPFWVRLVNNGVTLAASVSIDGENWLDVASVAVASFVAAINQVGIYHSTNPGNSIPNTIRRHLVMAWTVV